MSCAYHDRPEVFLAYVRQELPEQEQAEFEAHYLGCEECGREVFLMEKATLAMGHHGAVIFARAPQSLHAHFLTETLQKTRYWFGNVAVAWFQEHLPAVAGYVLLAVVLGVGYTWLLHQETSESKAPVTEASTGGGASSSHSRSSDALSAPAWPEDLSATIEDKASQAELEEAQRFYENQKYAAAAKHLAKLAQKHPEAGRIQLLWGVSLLRSNDFAGASTQLADFQRKYPHDWTALWFLTQAYLKQDLPDKATPLLRELSASNDSLYGAAASKVLKFIKDR